MNDWFHSKYKDRPTEYIIAMHKELPKLYCTVRRYAIANYGYERYGLEAIHNPALIQSVAAAYSNSIHATLTSAGGFDTCVVPSIERDAPVMLSVYGSAIYDNHAVVVTGYCIYRKTTTVLGINFYDYLYILRISDNHHVTARYFDLKDYGWICDYTTVVVNNE